MSLYWNDFYNQGTGLFGSQTGTGDITCSNIFCDFAINQIAGATLLVGDNTITTKIGKTTNGSTYINGNVYLTNSTTQNGFLRAVNGLIEANNTISGITIINPNIQSNINMRGFDIYNANNVYANNINDIISNIGNIQGNLNNYVLKAGDTMTGTLEIIGGSLAIKDTNTPPNYGGYVQITPNVGGLTKIYHSGDRGLDIDGQLANHRLRMTGFANITVDNPLFIQQTANIANKLNLNRTTDALYVAGYSEFKKAVSHYEPLIINNLVPNIFESRQVGYNYDLVASSVDYVIEPTATNTIDYKFGDVYDWRKIVMKSPLEVDRIEARVNTLTIGQADQTDVINIGTGSNIITINIGTGSVSETDTINIGSGNSIINMLGNTIYNQITNHFINDKDIVLNANAIGTQTSLNSGILVRDNGSDSAGFIKVGIGATDRWAMKAPLLPNIITFVPWGIVRGVLKATPDLFSPSESIISAELLVKNDLPSSTVYNDQNNTFSSFYTQTFNGTCNFNGTTSISGLNMVNTQIINLASPLSSSHATNKDYVDFNFANKYLTNTFTQEQTANVWTSQGVNLAFRVKRTDATRPQFLSFQDNAGAVSYGTMTVEGSSSANNAYPSYQNMLPYDLNIGGYNNLNTGTENNVNFFYRYNDLKLQFTDLIINAFDNIDMNTNYIGNLGAPTNPNDAVRKTYVDTNFAPNSYVNSTFAPNSYVNNQLALKYDKTGGTISGQVVVDNARLYVQRDGGNVLAGPYGDFQGHGTLFIAGKTNTNRNIAIGIDQTNDLYIIQAIEAGINLKTLSLNPSGGLVSIGSGGISCNYTPTTSTNLTTKAYVDSLVSGNVSALLSSNNTWTGNNTFNGATTTIGTSSKLVVDNIQSSNPTNLNIQFNSNTAFINNRIVQIDPLAETGLVIFGGNIDPAGTNPTTISGQNSFTISQVKVGTSNAGVYLQTWNSRVLYLNSLGGNDVTVGSQGGGAVNLNCWNNIRAYNKGNGGQYIQSYINTSDSNRGYLESVGTNITISASPSNTYNCIFKNLTLVQIGGAGSTIPLHTYGQNTMYDGANTGAYWQFNPTNGLIYNGGQSTTWDGQSQAGVNYNINNYASFNTNTPFVSTSAGNNISLRRNNDSTSPAKMILTNNAGSTTYGVVGIEDSSGGDILSGSTANSLVIGTPSNTNFFFIQNNSRAGIYRGNQWLYNKMDRPHMCWANNPEGNEGGNKLQVRYIKYSGSWPTTPTITSSDNYTQTIALDTLYSIITSSTSYIAMVAGTLSITSSGWYNITITYGQYLQGQIGRNSIYAIAGNATEEPFYCLSGDILFFEIYDWMANTGTSRTFSFKISQIYGI